VFGPDNERAINVRAVCCFSGPDEFQVGEGIASECAIVRQALQVLSHFDEKWKEAPFLVNGLGNVIFPEDRLGLGRIYLFTYDKADFYKGLGWREVRQVDRRQTVTIMTHS